MRQTVGGEHRQRGAQKGVLTEHQPQRAGRAKEAPADSRLERRPAVEGQRRQLGVDRVGAVDAADDARLAARARARVARPPGVDERDPRAAVAQRKSGEAAEHAGADHRDVEIAAHGRRRLGSSGWVGAGGGVGRLRTTHRAHCPGGERAAQQLASRPARRRARGTRRRDRTCPHWPASYRRVVQLFVAAAVSGRRNQAARCVCFAGAAHSWNDSSAYKEISCHVSSSLSSPCSLSPARPPFRRRRRLPRRPPPQAAQPPPTDRRRRRPAPRQVRADRDRRRPRGSARPRTARCSRRSCRRRGRWTRSSCARSGRAIRRCARR